LLLQFSNLVSFISLNVGHQSTIASVDDDAGWNIKKALQTRWWKDNGWANYGPIFFRTTHTMQYFFGKTANPIEGQDKETWERTAHFSLLLLGLISLYGCVFLLTTLLTASWPHRLILTIFLVSLSLMDPTWSIYMLRAHPDHMLMLTCALAFYCTLRWIADRGDEKFFFGSALLWGVAFGIKLTVILVYPALLFLFVPPFTKAQFKQALRYGGYVFLGYFIPGFPQTIVFDRPFKFLFRQDEFSQLGNMDSIFHWLSIWLHQSWKLVAAIVVLTLLLPPAKRVYKLNKSDLFRLCLLFLIPLCLILKRNISVKSDHYLMPFVFMFLLAIAALFSRLPRPAWSSSPWSLAAILFAMFATSGTTPAMMNEQLVSQLKCRSENEALYQKFKKWMTEEKIWADPYVPVDMMSDVQVDWQKTWKEVAAKNYSLLAFNRDYFQRYVGDEVSAYTKIDMPEWAAIREFYLSFVGKDEVTSPNGKVFRKIFNDNCGHEVWRMQR
jgi:hypothetical protein